MKDFTQPRCPPFSPTGVCCPSMCPMQHVLKPILNIFKNVFETCFKHVLNHIKVFHISKFRESRSPMDLNVYTPHGNPSCLSRSNILCSLPSFVYRVCLDEHVYLAFVLKSMWRQSAPYIHFHCTVYCTRHVAGEW